MAEGQEGTKVFISKISKQKSTHVQTGAAACQKIMITANAGTSFQLHCTLNAILSCSKIKGAPDLQLPLS
jgi:hypothetical protein